MHINKLTLIIIFFLAWDTSFAKDYKTIFTQTFAPCTAGNWAECENKFKGENRFKFGLPIELVKSKYIKSKYLNFIQNTYKSNCDTSNLIRQFVNIKKLNVAFKINEFINDNIKIKEKKGLIAYMLDRDNVIILVPNNGSYKILIPNAIEKAFRSSKPFRLYRYIRTLNNIHNYHIVKASRNNLSCDQFIAEMNEALSPIAYQTDRNQKNRIFYKKYIVRSAKEITQFYFPLNTNEKILNALKSN